MEIYDTPPFPLTGNAILFNHPSNSKYGAKSNIYNYKNKGLVPDYLKLFNYRRYFNRSTCGSVCLSVCLSLETKRFDDYSSNTSHALTCWLLVHHLLELFQAQSSISIRIKLRKCLQISSIK